MANIRIGENKEICRLGAAASKRVQQEKAERRWDEASLRCLHCNKPIDRIPGVQVAIQMKRKYCNQTCSAEARWDRYYKATGKTKPVHAPAVSEAPFKSKGEITRQMLRHLSKKVYYSKHPSNSCEICGYDKTKLEVAHIRSISSFPDSALSIEINQYSNLIGLCRNCHFEFDSGHISLEQINEKVAARG